MVLKIVITDMFSSLLFVVSLFEDRPMLVDISGSSPVKRLLPSVPKRSSFEEDELNEKQAAQDAKQNTCVTIFSSTGDHILAGTNKGWLNVIATETCRVIYSTHLCTHLIIMLRLASSGRDLVSNSTDRIIRTMRIPDFSQADSESASLKIEVEHKFQDIVNRLAWHHVAFSSTGEYVTASTISKHDIYLWERSQGSLVKILEGPQEELGTVEVESNESQAMLDFHADIRSGILTAPCSLLLVAIVESSTSSRL